MGLIDKIRNASLQRRINKKIQENNISKATPEIVVQAIVEETMNNKVLVETTKTLQRIGILETASTWNIEQTLNHNKSIVNLNTRVTTIEKTLADQPKTIRADEVLDTSDNTYKDVRHIQVNRATKADMVLWPDTNEYYPVDELPFLTKYLTTNGGTITGSLEVNNRLTMNGELVATQKWVQEHGGSGGSGDVTADGDNTFTGMNTFEGDVSLEGSTTTEMVLSGTTEQQKKVVVNKGYVDDTFYLAADGEDLYDQVVDLHANTLRLDITERKQTIEGPIEFKMAPYYTGNVDYAQLANTAFITKAMFEANKGSTPGSNESIKMLSGSNAVHCPTNTWTTIAVPITLESDFNTDRKFWFDIGQTGGVEAITFKSWAISDNVMTVNVAVLGRGYTVTPTVKLFYVINEAGGGSVEPSPIVPDLSQYVRKDETFSYLCDIACPWALDLQSQITSNGRLLGKVWDEGVVGGNAFGNKEQKIATQDWVYEELGKHQADAPSLSQSDFNKMFHTAAQSEVATEFKSTNWPGNADVWKTTYSFDGIKHKPNKLSGEDAVEVKYKFPTHREQDVGGNDPSTWRTEYTLATEEWVRPKKHALNVVYSFGDTQNIHRLQSLITVSTNVKAAVLQIKPWYNVIQHNWPSWETKPKWYELEEWIPIGSYSWDFYREEDGSYPYYWFEYVDIKFKYGNRGSLMLFITCYIKDFNVEQLIDNLIIKFDKYGSHLNTSDEETLWNQYNLRPYEWNEER